MKLLDRYLLRRYLVCLVYAMLSLICLSIIVDLTERIDLFIDHEAGVGQILQYYVYRTPYWVILTLPIATLLATMFSLTSLARGNEITSMKTVGISLYRILAPIVVFSLVFCAGAFLFLDQVVPWSTLRYNLIRNEIRSHDRSDGSRRQLLLQDVDGQLIFAKSYDAGNGTARAVSWERLSDHAVIERIVGKRMQWTGEAWTVYNAVNYRFRSDKPAEVTLIDSVQLTTLTLKPEDFARQQKKPEEMGYGELAAYIDRARANGDDATRHLVDLYLKVSFPVTCLIIVLVGAPLAANARQSGMANSVGLGALICFTYYSVVKAGQALGWNQILDPLLGAWLGNLVFGFLCLVLLWRAHK